MADRRDERPAPAYGEYAPEGWEWKPEGATPGEADAPARPDRAGVPHNLGVAQAPGGAPASPVAPRPETPEARSGGDPAPYRADAPPAPAPQQGQRRPRPAPATSSGAARPRRVGDIAVTIALLAIGAFGALYSGLVLFSMPSTLSLVSDALGVSDVSIPSWVGTFSTVSALSMFALYALALVFSIQRMRAGRLAFWVPLSAGVLATILTFVLTTIAMTSAPELMQAASDPDAVQKLLDYMNSMQP